MNVIPDFENAKMFDRCLLYTKLRYLEFEQNKILNKYAAIEILFPSFSGSFFLV